MKQEELERKRKLEEDSRRRATSLKYHHQVSLKESFQRSSPYSKHSSIMRKLAIFVGSTNVASRIVENVEFKDLLHSMDPRYPTPGLTVINKELDEVMFELKAKISVHLQSATKISLCADIWSKKELTSTYLKITAHFFSSKYQTCS